MPVITLPDGSLKTFDRAISVAEVAGSIGPGLAKAALAGKVDGSLVDTSSVIDHGFYYDFAYKRPFSTEDLSAIEKRMAEIAAKDLPVHRRVLPRDEAVAHFKKLGEHYKAEIIAAIPQGESISLYGQGAWEDLCRGPHVPSTGKLKAFKLMKVAGAYWRGDSRKIGRA